ncbi:MAG: phosphoserine phosphatase RsbU/P [Mycobacterium sp.]|nr:phosphoserine phosphatase RsbU/P [Mycobacterium sp.]
MTSVPDTPDDDFEELYENSPSGHLSTRPDGRIASINATLSLWLGHERNALRGTAFTDLLTVGSRIHYETHMAPLLQMHGQLAGVTVDLVTADGTRLPVFLTANVKTDDGGHPVLMRVTVQDARDRRSYERELLEARQRADHERARVKELATTLQRSLVPPKLFPPDGLDASAHYHPASTDDVGGDFYDLFPLARNKWGFFLGDVSGKGAGAAAITSLTRYTLRAAAVYDDDPVQVLKNLDTVLSHEFHGDDPRFCTVVFGVLVAARDGGFDVELATGGHPPALLIGADGRARYADTAGGHAVGILPEPQFTSARIHLAAGDVLVMYTDGLTEARIGAGSARYDDHDALLEFAATHGPVTAAAIVEEIKALLGSFGSGLEDDVAVMALGVPAPIRATGSES